MVHTGLACSDPGFCVVLREVLLGQRGFAICCETSLDTNAAKQIAAVKPDLVILETSDADNLNFADEIKSRQPGLPVFWICQQLTIEVERIARLHEIDAVFTKDEDLSILVQNAKAICDNETNA
jgi:DNA-binding NarL/FixJ family response regulator